MTNYGETSVNYIRSQRDKKIAADPLRWLNLVGLFWLEEGENSFGSDETNKISLPAFPQAYCGTFQFKDGIVTLHPAKGANITINGIAPEARPVATDREKTQI